MNNCKECMEQRASKEQNVATVPYFVHESDMARAERTTKRLWIALIVSIAALLASNVVFALNIFPL